MKITYTVFLLSSLLNLAFSQTKKDIKYDLSCLDTDAASTSTSLFGDMEKDLLNMFGSEVTIAEEI